MVLTSEKRAVAAPAPSASERTATTENAGARNSVRMANRKSCESVSSIPRRNATRERFIASSIVLDDVRSGLLGLKILSSPACEQHRSAKPIAQPVEAHELGLHSSAERFDSPLAPSRWSRMVPPDSDFD